MKGTSRFGATLYENYCVSKVVQVKSSDNPQLYLINNDILAENVYNTTGLWAFTIANFGKEKKLPVAYMRSHYWEFTLAKGLQNSKLASKPVLLLPGIYIKFHTHKFEVGIQEKESLVLDDPIKEVLPTENEAIVSLIDNYKVLEKHVPNFESARLRNYVNGISTYTADGLPIIDIVHTEKAETGNFITISGCNGYGVTWAGGIASAIANRDYNIINQLNASRFENMTHDQIINRARNIRHKKFK